MPVNKSRRDNENSVKIQKNMTILHGCHSSWKSWKSWNLAICPGMSWNVLEFPTFLSIVLEMSWNFLRSLNPFFYMQFFNCAIKSNEHQELCLSLLYISSLLIIGSTIIPFHGLVCFYLSPPWGRQVYKPHCVCVCVCVCVSANKWYGF